MSRKLIKLLEVTPTCTSLCCGAGMILCEIQLAERERALLELERRWRGEGGKWPQISMTAWLIP